MTISKHSTLDICQNLNIKIKCEIHVSRAAKGNSTLSINDMKFNSYCHLYLSVQVLGDL